MMDQRFLALLLACSAAAAPAWAERAAPPGEDADAAVAGAEESKLSLSGFGTLGLARTNSDDVQFVRYNQAEGVNSQYGSGLDSNLGLQATLKASPAVSATVQLLTRKYTSAHYSTDLTWAFVKLKLRDDLSLRLGRVVVPSFMTSDYQNVGYANTMMRPPIEMYGLAAIENVDGADLSYQRSFGDSTVTAQLAGGVARGKLFVAGGGGSIATYRAPLYTLNLALENGPLMLRFSRLRADLESTDTAPLNVIGARLEQAGFAQLARDMTLVGGKKIDFTSLGMTLDWRQLVLQSEYGRRRAAEPVYIPDNDSWYLMAGYRFGKVLPYYSHAAVRQAGRSITLPDNFPRRGSLARAVDMGFLTAGRQRSDLVGVRWNFAKSRALKVQLDRVHPTMKSGNMISGPADGLKHPVTVLGFAFDFVF